MAPPECRIFHVDMNLKPEDEDITPERLVADYLSVAANCLFDQTVEVLSAQVRLDAAQRDYDRAVKKLAEARKELDELLN